MKTVLYSDPPAEVEMQDNQATIMGIDPGAVSGAWAIREPDGEINVGDFAVVNGQLDGAAFSRLLRDMRVRLAVVENVGAMPKQGIASTFKFGVAVGIIRGVLMALGVPVVMVTPTTWKKHFNLIGKDKEAARAFAILTHPLLHGLDRKKDHGRADALLMLDWYCETKMGPQHGRLWSASTQDPDELD